MCQSVARPCSAEYWHIGAMAMRLASSSGPSLIGENSLLMGEDSPLVERASLARTLETRWHASIQLHHHDPGAQTHAHVRIREHDAFLVVLDGIDGIAVGGDDLALLERREILGVAPEAHA